MAAKIETVGGSMASAGSGLAPRLERLEVHYNNLAEHVLSIENKIDALTERGQITWPLIFTAVGTLVGIATLAGILHMQALQPIHQSLVAMEKVIDEHRALDAHPTALQAYVRNEGNYNAMNARVTAVLESHSRQLEKITEQVSELQNAP